MTRGYNVHGVTLRVRNDAGMESAGADSLERVSRRLSHFECELTGPPDLEFGFDEVAAIGSCLPAGGRPVYELERGEVRYAACRDLLTANYGNSLAMVCDIGCGNTRYQFARGVTAPEDAARAAANILFTLPLIELLRRRGLYNLHAAGVCRNGHALLLAGASGAGKSTLALELTRRGWDYLADDMVFLKSGCGHVFGFPEGIDYPAGGKSKRHIRPELVLGIAAVLQGAVRALVFPRVAMTAASVVEPISPAEAFLELAPNVLLTNRAACEAHFAVLEDLTRNAPAFRLETGTDFNEAAQVLGKVLDSC